MSIHKIFGFAILDFCKKKYDKCKKIMIKISTKLLNFKKKIFKLQVNEWIFFYIGQKIIQIKYEVLTDKKVECLPD